MRRCRPEAHKPIYRRILVDCTWLRPRLVDAGATARDFRKAAHAELARSAATACSRCRGLRDENDTARSVWRWRC